MNSIRINKYIALKKISTRRGADILIKEKKVFINTIRILLKTRNKRTLMHLLSVKSSKEISTLV